MTASLLTDTGGQLSMIPDELKALPHWVVWSYGKKPRPNGKFPKEPLQPHKRGDKAQVNHRAYWTDYETALAYAEAHPVEGLGFVLSEDDPYACIDLDACFDEQGELTEAAQAILASFPPTYVERSPSGTGLHVWVRGNLPPKHSLLGSFNRRGNLEVYDRNRYFTMTGDVWGDAPSSIAPAQDELTAFHLIHIAGRTPKAAVSTPVSVSTPQRPAQPLTGASRSDTDLISRMLNANTAPEIRARVTRLWAGDLSDYGNDHSTADLALCRELAFWTQDPEHIDRLFRSSGLYREKWDRADYRTATIAKALAHRGGRVLGADTPIPIRSAQRVSAGVAPEYFPAPEPEPIGPTLIVRSMADVEAKPIDWLWDGWIARGMLSILAGHPGEGKSTVSSDLAATLSHGGTWPDGSQAPTGKTLLLLGEESPEYVLKPRLTIFGADMRQLGVIDAVQESDGTERIPDLSRHLDALEAAITTEGYDLLIIDPVSSFLPRSNRNDEGAIRDLLTPVIKMAERTGCAVLAVMHLGKAQANVKRSALQQLLGSTGFGATARTVFMVSPMPSDPDRKALGIVKSNLGVFPPTLEWSRAVDAPITWHGTASHQIAALIEGTTETPRGEAGAWLKAFLADGPKAVTEVQEAAEAAGISERTLKRARQQLGVLSHRVNGSWQVRLPD